MNNNKLDTIVTLKDCHIAFTGFDERGEELNKFLQAQKERRSVEKSSTANVTELASAFDSCVFCTSSLTSLSFENMSLEECQSYIMKMEGIIDENMTSSTRFLIARRGLTRKRLVADKHNIIVVSPHFLEEALDHHKVLSEYNHFVECSRVKKESELVDDANDTSTSNEWIQIIRGLKDLKKLSSMYTVPYLYNYVFSGAYLSNEAEEEALKNYLQSRGARFFESVHSFTDVLFLPEDVFTRFKEWIRRVQKNKLFIHAWSLFQEETQLLETGFDMQQLGELQTLLTFDVAPKAEHSTDKESITKITHAIFHSVPIVNYNKFLFISQIPAPSHRNTNDQIPPSDFETIVASSEVEIPMSVFRLITFVSQETKFKQYSFTQDASTPLAEMRVQNGSRSSEPDAFYSEDDDNSSFAESVASSFEQEIQLFFESASGPNGTIQETDATVVGDYYSPPYTLTESKSDELELPPPHKQLESSNQNDFADRKERMKLKSAQDLRSIVSSYFDVRMKASTPLDLSNFQRQELKKVENTKRPNFLNKESHEEVIEQADFFESNDTLNVASHLREKEIDKVQNTIERNALTFSTLHSPPFLTVCLLYCTAKELTEAALACVGCRFIRVPTLTYDVDIVILGSLCLRKKKFTLSVKSGAHLESKHRISKKKNKALRGSSTFSNTNQGEETQDQYFSFYECTDHGIFYYLDKQYGIQRNQIAPIAWLKECLRLVQRISMLSPVGGFNHHKGNTLFPKGNDNFRKADAEHHSETAEEWMEETAELPASMLDLLTPLATENKSTINGNENEHRHFDPLPLYNHCAFKNTEEEYHKENDPLNLWRFTNTTFVEHFLSQLHPIGVGKYTIRFSKTIEEFEQSYKPKNDAQGQPILSNKNDFSKNQEEEIWLSRTNVHGGTLAKHDLDNKRNKLTLATQHESNLKLTVPFKSTQETKISPLTSATIDSNGITPSLHAPAQSQKKDLTEEERYELEKKTIAAKLQEIEETIFDKNLVHSNGDVFKGVKFCFIDGEFSRIDLGVARSLIRIGGGEHKKENNETWRAKLSSNHKKSRQKNDPEEGKATGDEAFYKQVRTNSLLGKHWQKWNEASQESQGRKEKALEILMASSSSMSTTKGNLGDDSQQMFINGSSHFFSTTDLNRIEDESMLDHSVSMHHDSVDFATKNDIHSLTDALERQDNKPYTSKSGLDSMLATIDSLNRKTIAAPAFYVVPHNFEKASLVPFFDGFHGKKGTVSKSNSNASKKINSLQYLRSVSSDYLLSCLAANKLLNINTCFVFYTTVEPQADGKFLVPSTGQKVTKKGNKNGPASPPIISAWLTTWRYAKMNSVGVCCSFVWEIPKDYMTTPDMQSETTQQIPNESVFPLLRSLFSAFSKFVQSLHGRVCDSYNVNVVTHVVIVNMAEILETPFSLCLGKKEFSALRTTNYHSSGISKIRPRSPLPLGENEENAIMDTEANENCRDKARESNLKSIRNYANESFYWPREDLLNALQDNQKGSNKLNRQQSEYFSVDNSRPTVSIVNLDYIEECVHWGTFINEMDDKFVPREIKRIETINEAPRDVADLFTASLNSLTPVQKRSLARVHEETERTPPLSPTRTTNVFARGSTVDASHFISPSTRCSEKRSSHGGLQNDMPNLNLLSTPPFRTSRTEIEPYSTPRVDQASKDSFRTPSSTPIQSIRNTQFLSSVERRKSAKHLRELSQSFSVQASPIRFLSQNMNVVKAHDEQLSGITEKKIVPDVLKTPNFTGLSFLNETLHSSQSGVAGNENSNSSVSSAMLLKAGVVCTPPLSPIQSASQPNHKRHRSPERFESDTRRKEQDHEFVPETRHEHSSSLVTPWKPTADLATGFIHPSYPLTEKEHNNLLDHNYLKRHKAEETDAVLVANSFVAETNAELAQHAPSFLDRTSGTETVGAKKTIGSIHGSDLVIGDSRHASGRNSTNIVVETAEQFLGAHMHGNLLEKENNDNHFPDGAKSDQQPDPLKPVEEFASRPSTSPPPQMLEVHDCEDDKQSDEAERHARIRDRRRAKYLSKSMSLSMASRSVTPPPAENRDGKANVTTLAQLTNEEPLMKIYVLHDVPDRKEMIHQIKKLANDLSSEFSRDDTENPPVIKRLFSFTENVKEAKVVVASDLNTRESILTALLLGLWIVQASWLEKIRDYLESFIKSPSFDVAAMSKEGLTNNTESKQFYVLREIESWLPVFEWKANNTLDVEETVVVHDCSNIISDELNKKVVDSCSRYRMKREAHESSLFGSNTFILLYLDAESEASEPSPVPLSSTEKNPKTRKRGRESVEMTNPSTQPLEESKHEISTTKNEIVVEGEKHARSVARVIEAGGGYVADMVRLNTLATGNSTDKQEPLIYLQSEVLVALPTNAETSEKHLMKKGSEKKKISIKEYELHYFIMDLQTLLLHLFFRSERSTADRCSLFRVSPEQTTSSLTILVRDEESIRIVLGKAKPKQKKKSLFLREMLREVQKIIDQISCEKEDPIMKEHRKKISEDDLKSLFFLRKTVQLLGASTRKQFNSKPEECARQSSVMNREGTDAARALHYLTTELTELQTQKKCTWNVEWKIQACTLLRSFEALPETAGELTEAILHLPAQMEVCYIEPPKKGTESLEFSSSLLFNVKRMDSVIDAIVGTDFSQTSLMEFSV